MSDQDMVNSPNHYKTKLEIRNQGELGVEVEDIAASLFGNDLHLGTAFIYLARAGKKENNDIEQEISKAIRWLEMKRDRLEQFGQ